MLDKVLLWFGLIWVQEGDLFRRRGWLPGVHALGYTDYRTVGSGFAGEHYGNGFTGETMRVYESRGRIIPWSKKRYD